MLNLLRKLVRRSDKSNVVSLEREAITHLLTWRTTNDVSVRSAAWHGLMKAADELVKLEKEKK